MSDKPSLTDVDLATIWARTASKCPGDMRHILAFARAAIAAEQAARPALTERISAMLRNTAEMGREQPGWHHAQGWNAALRQLLDYVNAGAHASPSEEAAPREALTDAANTAAT